jgi:hypothetical protein
MLALQNEMEISYSYNALQQLLVECAPSYLQDKNLEVSRPALLKLAFVELPQCR